MMKNEYLKIPASLFRPGEEARIDNRSVKSTVTVEIVTWRGQDSGYAYRVSAGHVRLWVAERQLKKIFEPCQTGELDTLLKGIWRPGAV